MLRWISFSFLSLCLVSATQASPKVHFLSGGFQGLYVLGLGYSFDAWKWDLSYGVTPDKQDQVEQVNLRFQRKILHSKLHEAWGWDLIKLGFLTSYALDDDYFVASPDRYPSSSYYLPNGLRMGLIVGTSLYQSKEHGWSFDLDAVTTDLHLISYYNNPDFFELEELISVAFSASLRF